LPHTDKSAGRVEALSPLASLAALSSRIRAGEITPAEIVERCLRRIDECDGGIQAWAYLAREEAQREAALLSGELKTRGPRGPLHGIPFGVKDIFDTAGMPTEWGSPICRGRLPGEDAALVAQLRKAGAIVLGKTHTTAFAYYDPGPTRNPHNLAHTSGGSSSGSAAAVAAGMIPFALGSQTQGSVLRPASFCGIVGLKPTFGRLPLQGVLPFAPSLDHAGLFTRTVEDMIFLWKALGNDALERPAELRLAFVPWPPDGGLEAEMSEAMNACRERLRASGAKVTEVVPAQGFIALSQATRTVMKYEGARFHGERFREHGEKIGAALAALVKEGLSIAEEDYRQALRVLESCRREMAVLSSEHPVWLTPAALGPAPEGLASTGDPRCNLPFTALGVPALTLPFARSKKGLPLGLQLTAPAGREDLLLAAALACERVFGSLPIS